MKKQIANLLRGRMFTIYIIMEFILWYIWDFSFTFLVFNTALSIIGKLLTLIALAIGMAIFFSIPDFKWFHATIRFLDEEVKETSNSKADEQFITLWGNITRTDNFDAIVNGLESFQKRALRPYIEDITQNKAEQEALMQRALKALIKDKESQEIWKKHALKTVKNILSHPDLKALLEKKETRHANMKGLLIRDGKLTEVQIERFTPYCLKAYDELTAK